MEAGGDTDGGCENISSRRRRRHPHGPDVIQRFCSKCEREVLSTATDYERSHLQDDLLCVTSKLEPPAGPGL